MNRITKLIFIGIFLGILLIPSLDELQAIAATLFTVTTDSGSLAVSSTGGVLPLKGGTGVKVSVIGSNVFINDTRIVTTGSLNQVRWGADMQDNYFSVQMEQSSQYPELVKNSQPFNGNVTVITIIPLVNTMHARVDLTLYDNGVSTGKTVIIPAGSTTGIITTLNQPFLKGDSLTWKLVTVSTDVNSLLFNVQVIINYNG